MQHRRNALSLTAICAASVLLLTACGGGGDDDGKSDKIDGAKDSASGSPSPSKSEAAGDKVSPTDFRTSDIKLPDDLKLVFDWKQPSDKTKAGALAGAADYLRAVMYGSVAQDSKDPVISRHTVPLQTAQQFATNLVSYNVKRKLTVTGTERYYKEQIGDVVDGKLVSVSFCVNQAKLFNKEIKSGKVRRTEENADSYLHYELVMEKPEKPSQVWKARTLDGESGAVKQCRD